MRNHARGIGVVLCGLLVGPSWANTPLVNPIAATIQKSNITVELQTIATGLNSPVHLTGAGDGSGKLYAVDQSGLIRLIQNDVLQATPFLDVAANLGSDTLIASGERGLLGLAFHPDFETSGADGYGKFYTYSSVALTANTDFEDGLVNSGSPPAGQNLTNHQSVIHEWTMSTTTPGTVDVGSRRAVMRIDQPQSNHNGGMLEFGPDGYLYATLGDGGSRDDGNTNPNSNSGHGTHGNGQNPHAILGKILRIDPLSPATHMTADPASTNGQYRTPTSNPFDGTTGLREVFALGLRNPFRVSFDQVTQSMIVADVGQDKIEEVDRINYTTGAGSNFGWRIKEGTFNFDPNSTSPGFVYNDMGPIYPDPLNPPTLVDPVAQYDHDDGIAVIGGYVWRDMDPSPLEGLYVFGDYAKNPALASGRLFVSDLDTGLIEELRIGLADQGLNLYLKGFGRDDAGNLYVLGSLQAAYASGGTTGVVLRISAMPEPTTAAMVVLGGATLLRRRGRRG